MTLIQTAFSYFWPKNNTQINTVDTQNSFMVVEIPDDEKLQEEENEQISFAPRRIQANERLREGRNEYCNRLVNEQLDETDRKLDDLLHDLNKNWLKKTVLGENLEEVTTNITQAKEVIDEARHALDENNLHSKWKALEAVILKIGKNLAALNIPFVSNHETINGVFNFMSLAGIAAWTYLADKQKINELTPGYILIPLVINIIPNIVKVLTLIKTKANRMQIEDKIILDLTYRSLTPNLETLAKTVYEEKTEDKIRMAESRLFLRLSLRDDRRSCEIQNACFRPAFA